MDEYRLRMLNERIEKCHNEYVKRNGTSEQLIHKGMLGEKVEIIAGGPSLNDSFELIDSTSTIITVNKVVCDERIRKLKPQYHVMYDSSIVVLDRNACNVICECLQCGDIGKFIVSDSVYNEWKKYYPTDNVIMLNTCISRNKYETDIFLENYKLNKLMPVSGTVAVTALYVALQIGASEIKIHGLDLGVVKGVWVDENNHLHDTYEHFYDKMDFDYYEQNQKGELCGKVLPRYGMLEHLYEAVKCYEGLSQINDYAQDLGCKIVNMNPKSFVDYFEKYKF